MTVLIGWVDRWVQGSAGRLKVDGRSLEQEHHHWNLRSGGRWGVVAGTNYVIAARAHSSCVREVK